MKALLPIFLALLLPSFLVSCDTKKQSSDDSVEESEVRRLVELVTDHGSMTIELYNETPLHRDNFIKLSEEGMYDSLLFHRVINEFMIQSGDPDSKNAMAGDTLGNGGLDYKVPAEFNKALFHKKGVLAAARDGNPERASSSTQFYIVQGKVFNDSLLDKAEERINGWLGEFYFKQDPKNKSLVDSLQSAIDNENFERYAFFNDSIRKMAENYDEFDRYVIPESHREVYRTTGGTPHLDQNYTVYGEVIQGIEVIDSIASEETGPFDRPVTDIRIQSVRVVK